MSAALAPVLRRVVSSLLVVGVIAALMSQPGPDRKEITAEFARAGLSVRAGDEVRLRGVPIGRISSIDVRRDTFTATYVLSVDSEAPIAADTGATLVPKTLFGEKYVALDPAEPGGAVVADGAAIPLERTAAPSEIQEVLDRLEPVLDAVDPVAFSATISSLAQGLDGHGADLATVVESLPPALQALVRNQDDLGRIFRSVPGIAGTVTERADQLLQTADAFGELAVLVDENETLLVDFVRDTAQLSARAASILDAEAERIDRVLTDGLAVLTLVDRRPGAVDALLKGAPQFVNGLASATITGAFRAPIANFGVLNPGSLLDATGDFAEARGGAGVGPDIVVEGFPLDGVDVGTETGGDPATETGNAVVGLLNALLGGGR